MSSQPSAASIDAASHASEAASGLRQLHDTLTGLPGRGLLHDRVSQAMRLADRDGRSLALGVLGVDHALDDDALREVAFRLRSTLRASDTVARLGSDVFAVLMPDTECAFAMLAAQKVVGLFATGARVGIAVYPDSGDDADGLLRSAEIAMRTAASTGTGYCVYTPDQDQSSRLTLVGSLRRAIANDELTLCYQPKVDTRSGGVVGVEALVRWQHPRLGAIRTDRFIPLAEQTGLIRPLTRWVLEAAIGRAREWHAAGLALSMGVNLSAHDLQDADLPRWLSSVLYRSGVGSRWLTLELTESALMSDPDAALGVLSALHDLGARIAIDDFGTGYSSLAYLKRLPADELKIDRSFVVDMASDDRDRAIVRSTIELGHSLGLVVVGEGAEDQPTLELLSALGCDLAQGDAVSKPLPAPDLLAWSHSQRGRRNGPTPA